ncbi:hypothetical protein KO317_01725 [Candidatus Micrarchaeota archaeon]|nr:hypothetical protein [Candidatus Micrarchaeota archaeon]
MDRPRLFCDSCGMRMEESGDHGGGKQDNPYCKNCCDETGVLKPKSVIRETLIKFYIEKYDYPKTAAENFVDDFMATMPAWQNKQEKL